MTFYLPTFLDSALSGVLIGIQQGARVASGSTAAIGLNAGLLATKVLYASYLSAILPHVSPSWHPY